MEIEQVELAATTLAVVRERVPMDALAEFYERAYGTVAAALAAAGITPAGPAFGWYADMPTQDVEVAAGFPVPPGSAPDGVELLSLPAGPAVVTTFVGPYDGLPQVWGELGRWCAEHGLAGRGDFWEEYLNDPSPEDPASNVTRLVIPLA